jgi:small GTP-binding protein
MTLHFWDTAGMERYRSITLAHYRKAMGALIVYDITKHSSFANCTLWHEDLKMHAGEKVVIALAGNKFDVVRAYPQERRVTTE